MACLCVIYEDDTQVFGNSQYIFFNKCFRVEAESAACGCRKRTILQFPQTAAAQNTELRATFLRQEVAIGSFKEIGQESESAIWPRSLWTIPITPQASAGYVLQGTL
jgi:hypothetical protein